MAKDFFRFSTHLTISPEEAEWLSTFMQARLHMQGSSTDVSFPLFVWDIDWSERGNRLFLEIDEDWSIGVDAMAQVEDLLTNFLVRWPRNEPVFLTYAEGREGNYGGGGIVFSRGECERAVGYSSCHISQWVQMKKESYAKTTPTLQESTNVGDSRIDEGLVRSNG